MVVSYGGIYETWEWTTRLQPEFCNLKEQFHNKEMTFDSNLQTLYRKSVALNLSIDIVAHEENYNPFELARERISYLLSSRCFCQEEAILSCSPTPWNKWMEIVSFINMKIEKYKGDKKYMLLCSSNIFVYYREGSIYPGMFIGKFFTWNHLRCVFFLPLQVLKF